MQAKKLKTKTKEEQNFSTQKYYRIKADFTYMAAYNYFIEKQIGRGGYGVVYKAIHKLFAPSEVAIKINFNTVSREIIYAQMAFLILVKGMCNLPKLVNLFVHHNITHIVLEYFTYTPFIVFFNTFTIQQSKHYILQLLIGLRNLKKVGIYHRDIKPGNFLYNPKTKRGIIIDFGLAQLDPNFVSDLQSKCSSGQLIPEGIQKLRIYQRLTQCIKTVGRNKIGTETFMPLQSILHYPKQSYSSDIWPVGVILLQILLRKYNVFNNVRMINRPNNVKNNYYINYIIELANFFGTDAVIAQCRRIGYNVQLPKDIPYTNLRNIVNIDGYDDATDDILHKLLDINHETRISVEKAIEHPFFDSVRQEHQL